MFPASAARDDHPGDGGRDDNPAASRAELAATDAASGGAARFRLGGDHHRCNELAGGPRIKCADSVAANGLAERTDRLVKDLCGVIGSRRVDGWVAAMSVAKTRLEGVELPGGTGRVGENHPIAIAGDAATRGHHDKGPFTPRCGTDYSGGLGRRHDRHDTCPPLKRGGQRRLIRGKNVRDVDVDAAEMVTSVFAGRMAQVRRLVNRQLETIPSVARVGNDDRDGELVGEDRRRDPHSPNHDCCRGHKQQRK